MLYFCEAVYVWISSLPARDMAFASPKGEKNRPFRPLLLLVDSQLVFLDDNGEGDSGE